MWWQSCRAHVKCYSTFAEYTNCSVIAQLLTIYIVAVNSIGARYAVTACSVFAHYVVRRGWPSYRLCGYNVIIRGRNFRVIKIAESAGL